jgi:hypothetical protein
MSKIVYQYDGANRLIGRTSSEGQDSFVQAGWLLFPRYTGHTEKAV